MKHIRNANALVTGSSRGLGPYMARALAANGANVAVTARTSEPLEDLAESLRKYDVQSAALPADVSLATDRVTLVNRATSALGGIDILVNNAGIESEGAFLEIDNTTIEQTVEVNLTAPMHLARLVLPQMVEAGHGHIVSVSSVGGKRGAPYDAVYCGTKAGLIQWSNALRLELKGTGVGVSVICPGYVTSVGMFAKFGIDPPMTLGSCTPEQVAKSLVRVIAHNRPELIVNSRPVRPLLGLGELFPRIADWMVGALGITKFQRRKVEGRNGTEIH
jgi:short-subunit dehydrogenase